MFAQMFDLDRRVVSDLGKFAVQGFDDWDRVAHRIEKVRIAKGDVLSAGGDLLANIREDDFWIHEAKRAIVNRNDGTVPAMVLAAATRLGVADGAMLAAGKDQMRVRLQRGQAVAIRNFEAQSCKGNV